MKYKTRKIPGSPDWMPEGVMCKVWDRNSSDAQQEDLIMGYVNGNDYKFVGLCMCHKHAEPIPIWEPTPGEYCAFWDSDRLNESEFAIDKYIVQSPTGYFKTFSGALWRHTARITGVDCACSLEELKERTDWL